MMWNRPQGRAPWVWAAIPCGFAFRDATAGGRPYAALILMALLLGGCASAPRLRGGIPGDKLVATARQAIGVKYKFGGNGTGEGFDCSGLVCWAFRRNGVRVPRSTGALFDEGEPVKRGDLQPGDLVFFDITGAGPSHVGIYSGNDRMIHAPSSGSKVREESINIPYWVKRFLGGRRLD